MAERDFLDSFFGGEFEEDCQNAEQAINEISRYTLELISANPENPETNSNSDAAIFNDTSVQQSSGTGVPIQTLVSIMNRAPVAHSSTIGDAPSDMNANSNLPTIFEDQIESSLDKINCNPMNFGNFI